MPAAAGAPIGRGAPFLKRAAAQDPLMARRAPDDLNPLAAPQGAADAPARTVHLHASGGKRVNVAHLMQSVLIFRRRCIRDGEFGEPEPDSDGASSDDDSGDDAGDRAPPPAGAIAAAADLPVALAGREGEAWAAASLFGWAFAEDRLISAADVRELLAELDFPTRALVYRWFELLAAELAARPALAAAPKNDLFQLVALGREWCDFADGGDALEFLRGRFQAVDLEAELRP